MIPLFIQLTFTKHLPLYSIYLFPHIICFLISLKFCGLLFSPPLQVIHVFNNFEININIMALHSTFNYAILFTSSIFVLSTMFRFCRYCLPVYHIQILFFIIIVSQQKLPFLQLHLNYHDDAKMNQSFIANKRNFKKKFINIKKNILNRQLRSYLI